MHESTDIGEVDGLEGMRTNVPQQGQEAENLWEPLWRVWGQSPQKLTIKQAKDDQL